MLTPSQQRHTVAACFLSWTLDAFDFFIMVFVLADIANEFGTGIPAVTIAITLTLAARPLGALLFGYMADRIGRRRVLIANVRLSSLSLGSRRRSSPSLSFGHCSASPWGASGVLALR